MIPSSEDALELLYGKYRGFISKKIRDFGFNSDFDDIFQESMLVFEISIEKYSDEEVPFCAYFSTNLRNRLITLSDRNRRNKRVVVDDDLFLHEKCSSIDDTLEDYDIFKCLSEEEKRAITLYYSKNVSVRRIAFLMNIKEMDVYYLLKKARDKMKKKIGE